MQDKKIFNSMAIFAMVVFVGMIIALTYNFRDFGLNAAKSKAKVVAQSVKNGLTAHMVNGIMDNREFFINQTKKLDNIDDIWIVRANVVVEQYGKGFEKAHDTIDKKALQSGKIIESIEENLIGSSTYRITIPYKAEITKDISCLECHKAKVGDTLGAISMVMSLDDVKETSIKVIGITASIVLFLLISMILFVRKITTPYYSIFALIKDVMEKANRGDYSGRIKNIQQGEAKEVAHWINEHMEKLQLSLGKIGSKIDVFLTAHKEEDVIDPIEDVAKTVNRLADIYQFRKTIERDEKIEDVYRRFAVVLEEKFNITNFNFLEADTTNKTIEVVYINKELLCDPLAEGCRADRTNVIVDSCQFKEVCPKFNVPDKHYICIPYSISNDMDFIVSLVTDTKEDQERVRKLLPFIQDYVDSAKPEIVSKKLMQILERNAQTDPLTGLYNRKFLEKYIDGSLYTGIYQKVPCGIMMVDIDFFKQINDNYGHDIGDIAIKTIANTLLDVVSEKDKVIRFGGEEFIVVIVECNEEKLETLAQEIRIAFSQQQIQANSETFTKTVSIGTSLFPNTHKDFWKYVKQSDIALYQAKQSGRNKVVRYNTALENK